MRPTSSESAELSGYKLVFDHPGIPLLEPSFANVQQSHGNKVHGVLYHLTKSDMDLLKKLEGGAYKNLELDVVGKISGHTTAHVFWTPNTGITHLRPSRRYMNILIQGAREHKLPAEWIHFLKEHPQSPYYPILSSGMKIVMPLLNKLFKLGMGTPFKKWKEKQHRKAQAIIY